MTRVLIVDDEPLARARMAALLGQCADIEIVGSAADGEATLAAIGELQPDVVIFCTAYEAHALKAFELGAVDYLLKPVRLERLRDALQRAQRRLADAPREAVVYLHGRLGGEQVRIALDEVTCLLADEKYVVVHHQRGELLIEESLRQLEETYPDQLSARLGQLGWWILLLVHPLTIYKIWFTEDGWLWLAPVVVMQVSFFAIFGRDVGTR